MHGNLICKHLTICPYEQIKCSCEKMICRKDTETHLKNECPLADTKCEYCGSSVKRDMMNIHYGIDEKKESDIKMENVCPASAPEDTSCRKCPEYGIFCPFRKYGCNDLIKRKDLDSHLAKNGSKHMNLRIRPAYPVDLSMSTYGVVEICQQNINILGTPYLVGQDHSRHPGLFLANLGHCTKVLRFVVQTNGDPVLVFRPFPPNTSIHICYVNYNDVNGSVFGRMTEIEEWLP
jgi:hypothetical protein